MPVDAARFAHPVGDADHRLLALAQAHWVLKDTLAFRVGVGAKFGVCLADLGTGDVVKLMPFQCFLHEQPEAVAFGQQRIHPFTLGIGQGKVAGFRKLRLQLHEPGQRPAQNPAPFLAQKHMVKVQNPFYRPVCQLYRG